MREILFRGKSVSNNEWVEGFYEYSYMYDSLRECHRIIWVDKPTRTNYLSEVIPETVGRYTGKEDIHYDRIFEGDIVSKVVNDKVLTGKVEYADGAFGVRFADGSGQFLCFFADDCEIIGNIYDTPEFMGN